MIRSHLNLTCLLNRSNGGVTFCGGHCQWPSLSQWAHYLTRPLPSMTISVCVSILLGAAPGTSSKPADISCLDRYLTEKCISYVKAIDGTLFSVVTMPFANRFVPLIVTLPDRTLKWPFTTRTTNVFIHVFSLARNRQPIFAP